MLKEYPKNRYEEMLAILKSESSKGVPLVIKGGGVLGKRTIDYLEYKGIRVECVVVDRTYFSPGMEIKNKKVYISEDYILKHECNLIVAHLGYEENQISNEMRKNIVHLFDYDFHGLLAFADKDNNIITESYLKSREKDVGYIYSILQDEKSEKSLDDFLYQRIYGNYTKEYDTNQYFANDIVKVGENEVYVDCGAYHGENIVDFINFIKSKGISGYDKIVAFEPDADNIEHMKQNIGNISAIEFLQAGVYNESTTLWFQSGEGTASCVSEKGNVSIDVKSIDDVLNGEKATFIKMDIEGLEMKALEGAKRTILDYRPKLAICIYHKKEDFIDIPLYVLSLNPEYKIYFRNYDSSGAELVMYAV